MSEDGRGEQLSFKRIVRDYWVLILALLLWAAASFFIAPRFGTTDVYLFRDAPVNFARAEGFRTASFEHSTSFNNLVYSSYTPGSLWVFVPFAAIFRNLLIAASVYDYLSIALITIVALYLATRALQPGILRTLIILLFAVTIPVGYVGNQNDRPEILSFLGLLLETYLISRRMPAWISGLVAGILFLIQPFAGVIAVILIAASMLLRSLRRREKGWIMREIRSALFGAMAFSLPILITAIAFEKTDGQSLARFKNQALVGGLNRTVGASVAGRAEIIAPAPPEGAISKYRSALKWQASLGPLNLLSLAGTALFVLIWIGSGVLSRGTVSSRLALLACGVITLVLPFLAFPIQSNYMMLGRAVFPFLLLLNYGGVWCALNWKSLPAFLVLTNLCLLLPGEFLSVLTRIETRQSSLQAINQVELLHSELTKNGVANGVILVPATHYFLYKNRLENVFNPVYLSPSHPSGQIAAIVNCPAGTNSTKASDLPLPIGVEKRSWSLLSDNHTPVWITFLGHKLMRKNWTMGCAVYLHTPSSTNR